MHVYAYYIKCKYIKMISLVWTLLAGIMVFGVKVLLERKIGVLTVVFSDCAVPERLKSTRLVGSWEVKQVLSSLYTSYDRKVHSGNFDHFEASTALIGQSIEASSIQVFSSVFSMLGQGE